MKKHRRHTELTCNQLLPVRSAACSRSARIYPGRERSVGLPSRNRRERSGHVSYGPSCFSSVNRLIGFMCPYSDMAAKGYSLSPYVLRENVRGTRCQEPVRRVWRCWNEGHWLGSRIVGGRRGFLCFSRSSSMSFKASSWDSNSSIRLSRS